MLNTAICDMYAHRIKQVVISRWDRISVWIKIIEAYQYTVVELFVLLVQESRYLNYWLFKYKYYNGNVSGGL